MIEMGQQNMCRFSETNVVIVQNRPGRLTRAHTRPSAKAPKHIKTKPRHSQMYQ